MDKKSKDKTKETKETEEKVSFSIAVPKKTAIKFDQIKSKKFMSRTGYINQLIKDEVEYHERTESNFKD